MAHRWRLALHGKHFKGYKMPTPETLINWSDYKVLKKQGYSEKEIAALLGTTLRTLQRQLKKYVIDENDLSDVPPEVFEKWNTGITGNKAKTILEETELSWIDVADYLGIGLTIKETSAACGLTPSGLEALYNRDKPSIFDCLETWATVLRARKNYELFKAIEKRALNGDLRAAVVLGKMRHQRWPKDTVEPPNHIHEI